MTVLIDIPEKVLNSIKTFKGKFICENGYDLIQAIQNGTPLPKGHWIEENINEWSRKVFCSECGCPPPFEYVSNGDVYSASGYGVINKTKFCPNCGADMRGDT